MGNVDSAPCIVHRAKHRCLAWSSGGRGKHLVLDRSLAPVRFQQRVVVRVRNRRAGRCNIERTSKRAEKTRTCIKRMPLKLLSFDFSDASHFAGSSAILFATGEAGSA